MIRKSNNSFVIDERELGAWVFTILAVASPIVVVTVVYVFCELFVSF